MVERDARALAEDPQGVRHSERLEAEHVERDAAADPRSPLVTTRVGIIYCTDRIETSPPNEQTAIAVTHSNA